MRNLRWRIRRKFATKFQVKVDGNLFPRDGLRLHLGCGPIALEGWVGIDAGDFSHAHLKAEGFGLASFGESSASAVYACHCLEHLQDTELTNVLSEVRRVLRPEGLFLVSVPDFDLLMSAYLKDGDIGAIRGAVLGGQDHIHNIHHQIFNQRSLRECLEQAGFLVHERWETTDIFGKDLGDWSSYSQKVGGEMVKISLNLLATRA